MVFRRFRTALIISVLIFFCVPNAFAAKVSVSWDPPTVNADGSELTDLAGFVVFYGRSRKNLKKARDIGMDTEFTIKRLKRKSRYFVGVAAYDESANLSELSSILKIKKRHLRRR